MFLGVMDLRVVELAQWAQPVANQWLAIMGADVIKVEEPRHGDASRGFVFFDFAGHPCQDWLWDLTNSNKRSIALDIKTEKGKEILYQMIKRADVFLTNLRQGVLKRRKIDAKTLLDINPRLIYVGASGYGRQGPDTERPAFDELAFWARSGFWSTLGDPSGTPVTIPIEYGGIGDISNAMNLLAGIGMALLARERTGKGQEVHCSLFGSGLWATRYIGQPILLGREPPKRGRTELGNPLISWYQTKDGKWVVLLMPQSDLYWPRFCQAIGMPSLAIDPRFSSADKRAENRAALYPIIDEAMATKSESEWSKVFVEHDIIFSPIKTLNEALHDPQALANNYVIEVDHPSYGRIKVVNWPIQLSTAQQSQWGRAPRLGEHSEEVLLELGYTWEEIVKLRDEGVAGPQTA